MGTFERPDIEVILEHYGGEPPGGYGWKPMRCILHDDTRASASVNVAEGKYNCHTCLTQAVDGLDIIQQKEGIDLAAAVKFAGALGGSGGRVREPARREDGMLPTRRAGTGRGRSPYKPPGSRR